MKKIQENYTLLCDFYELTMSNGYFLAGMQDTIAYFDVFYRTVPDNGGYAICAGLDQVIDYIQNLYFDEDDIEFLRSKKIFDEKFLAFLR
ncbi:MAG TPA: nicotinate phosphoribosyltransferase, partial [Bacillota bacterium]|nr:nicotinate phosphoribosyltransferase [Bacillota bacterium]